MKLTLETLERWLWDSADLMRGHIDSSDFKNYIFGLLFLKRANDQFFEEANLAVQEEGISLEEALEDEDYHQFFIPKAAYWKELTKKTENIGQALDKAFAAIEEINPQLEGVMTAVHFGDSEKLPDNLLSRLLQHFNKYSLANADLENPDILGNAYEYLIREFAGDAGKAGGEFYTPKEVVKLVVGLIKPEAGNSIYDPTCGSGGMLIESAHYIKEHGGVVDKYINASLFGQEKNLGTWAIAKINMIVHNFIDSDIRKGDTLAHLQHTQNGELMTFDRVIANPPFSLKKWWAPAEVDIKTDEKGWILVNEYLETTKPNIWAFGDAIGKYMYRHAANYEAEIAWINAFGEHGHKIAVDFSAIPHAVYSHPQIGSVGLTEYQARQQRHDILVGRWEYKDTAKGSAMGDPRGFVKVIVEKKTYRILGCHVVGHCAPVLVQEVVNVMNYGVFVRLEDGIEGLVHISEMSWTRRLNHPSEVLNLGDEIEVVVLSINKDKQEISLGLKQTKTNPWAIASQKYPAGTIVTATVRSITNFGAFVEIEPGIDGMVHISDLSWTRKYGHPSDALQKGQELKCVVIEIDEEKQRISLGVKQMTEDPWLRQIPEHYIPGQIVKGKATKITNFGIFVELEQDLEGLLHISELADYKVDNPEDVVKVGEEIEVKILRVDPEERKIGLSLKRAQWAAEDGVPSETPTEPVRRRGGLDADSGPLGVAGERIIPATRGAEPAPSDDDAPPQRQQPEIDQKTADQIAMEALGDQPVVDTPAEPAGENESSQPGQQAEEENKQ